MLIKAIIVCLLIFIVLNLFRALPVMLKNNPAKKPASHYLGLRIVFSVIAFAILLVAVAAGVIEPNPRPY